MSTDGPVVRFLNNALESSRSFHSAHNRENNQSLHDLRRAGPTKHSDDITDKAGRALFVLLASASIAPRQGMRIAPSPIGGETITLTEGKAHRLLGTGVIEIQSDLSIILTGRGAEKITAENLEYGRQILARVPAQSTRSTIVLVGLAAVILLGAILAIVN